MLLMAVWQTRQKAEIERSFIKVTEERLKELKDSDSSQNKKQTRKIHLRCHYQISSNVSHDVELKIRLKDLKDSDSSQNQEQTPTRKKSKGPLKNQFVDQIFIYRKIG